MPSPETEAAAEELMRQNLYPQPCTARFVGQALAEGMPQEVQQQLAMACAQLGPSYHEGRNAAALQRIGSVIDNWLESVAWSQALLATQEQKEPATC